ncbi:MAG: hypothetical protein E7655_01030 [Ruminococcaceae bacterium]|nr:hypothetical protein [Oscillospiraceae bacterium]
MKKALLFLLTLSLMFLLCSCKVNWFGQSFEVPWYFVVLPVCVIFLLSYVLLMSFSFVCPKCQTVFKPKWYQLSVCIHIGRKRLAKCPHCGYKGFCKRHR